TPDAGVERGPQPALSLVPVNDGPGIDRDREREPGAAVVRGRDLDRVRQEIERAGRFAVAHDRDAGDVHALAEVRHGRGERRQAQQAQGKAALRHGQVPLPGRKPRDCSTCTGPITTVSRSLGSQCIPSWTLPSGMTSVSRYSKSGQASPVAGSRRLVRKTGSIW